MFEFWIKLNISKQYEREHLMVCDKSNDKSFGSAQSDQSLLSA